MALTPEFIAMLKEAIDTREYASTNEVVRDALRAWKTRRTSHKLEVEELRQLWSDGLASGDAIDAQPVFTRLHEKYEIQTTAE